MKQIIRSEKQRRTRDRARKAEDYRAPDKPQCPQRKQAGDPFAAFCEWFGEADEKAYAKL